MKKIIAWFVYSSKNPKRVSLSFKGLLGAAATYIIFFAGVFHLNISQTDLSSTIDALTNVVKFIFEVISWCITGYGMIRKIYLTSKGQNAVLNEAETL